MNPPRWLESTLCLLLRPEDRESVSGDLLEEYRECIRPAVGRWHADLWYSKQVGGFLWRASWIWGVLLGSASVARVALDAFAPVANYGERAALSTYLHATICLIAGFWSAWRAVRITTGALVGLAAGIISSMISVGGAIGLVAIWHDPQTLRAIDQSGGLDESLVLPLMVIPIIMLLGTVGAVPGKCVAIVRNVISSRSI